MCEWRPQAPRMPPLPETVQRARDQPSAEGARAAWRPCHGARAPPGIHNAALLGGPSRIRRPRTPGQQGHDHVVPHPSADPCLSVESLGTKRTTARGLVDQVANRTRPPVERRAVPLRGSVCDSRGPLPQVRRRSAPRGRARQSPGWRCRRMPARPVRHPWRIECGRRLAKNARQSCQGFSVHSHIPGHGRCRRYVSRPCAMGDGHVCRARCRQRAR